MEDVPPGSRGKSAAAAEDSSKGKKLPKEQLTALRLLTHYHLMTNKEGGSEIKRKAIGQAELFVRMYTNRWRSAAPDMEKAQKQFSNFLDGNTAGPAPFVLDYFEKHHAKLANVPELIRPIMAAAFGRLGSTDGPGTSLGETIRQVTSEGEPFIDEIVSAYAGLWDVVRYSSHGGPFYPAKQDPRMMRAAMAISVPDDSGYPQFEIRYRPGSLVKTDEFFLSKGSIYPLGKAQHLLFFGWESPSLYPIEITARIERAHRKGKEAPYFFGLVTRRHEKGPIFASRVLFLRSRKKSLDTMSRKQQIGMFHRSELLKTLAREHREIVDIDRLVGRVINRVGSEGRSGLWLEDD